LRHFYVLAIESRLIQARDIDSGAFLNIKMNVEVFEDADSQMVCDEEHSISNQVVTITTPDIVNGRIKSIEVKNELFHNVKISFG
jgi:hypothetical protein